MLYKQILVAVDESNTSEQALNEAIKFAKENEEATLHLLHVIDAFFINWGTQPLNPKAIEESMREAGNKLLDDMAKKVRASGIEHCQTHLVDLQRTDHRIEEKVIEVAADCHAELIIIGTHGRRGFHHFLLGSVAEGVIRIAPIPVLLVRGR